MERCRREENDASTLFEEKTNTENEMGSIPSSSPLLCWGLAGPDEAEEEDGRRRRRRPAGTPTSPNTRVGAKRRREEHTSALNGYPTHTLLFYSRLESWMPERRPLASSHVIPKPKPTTQNTTATSPASVTLMSVLPRSSFRISFSPFS